MKIIDGKNATLGRLASYVAKQVLGGEEIVILNCEEIIIKGNKKDIKNNFYKKRSRVGSSQKGPKHSKKPELIVKRTIRSMLPEHRRKTGKDFLKKIKCYCKTPKEFEDKKKISSGKKTENKFIYLKQI